MNNTQESTFTKNRPLIIVIAVIAVLAVVSCCCLFSGVAAFLMYESGTLPIDSGAPSEPTAPPPASGAVTILAFTVDPNRIAPGGCVVLAWAVENADLVQLKRDDAVILDNANLKDSYQDCLNESGTYRYRVEASNSDNYYNWMELQVIVSE